MKTSDSGTLLAQGTRLLIADASKVGALPGAFWHSWHSSTILETQLTDSLFSDILLTQPTLELL